MPEDYRGFAKVVRIKLFAKRKTVVWGAEQLDVSRQYLHAIFNGKERRLDLLQKLDNILEEVEDTAFYLAA